jgi:membrane protease YdiL (CAAX protease family)
MAADAEKYMRFLEIRMATQVSETSFSGKDITAQVSWGKRITWFIVLLVCSVAVIIFGSTYFDIFPTNKNTIFLVVLAVTCLAATVFLRRIKGWRIYADIAYAFFVAAMVYLVPFLLVGWENSAMRWFHETAASTRGLAIVKVLEVTPVVVTILVLTKLSGADLGSIFIKRGNMKLGMSVSALVFFNFASSALLFFATRFTSIGRLGAAVGWGLVFSLANGFMEELWIRSIFLRRFQPLLGAGGSILLTSIIFGVMHGGAYYFTPYVLPIMVVNTFTLGLTCGYLMWKTDSIWGPALIHAAADLFLFIAVLSVA